MVHHQCCQFIHEKNSTNLVLIIKTPLFFRFWYSCGIYITTSWPSSVMILIVKWIGREECLHDALHLLHWKKSFPDVFSSTDAKHRGHFKFLWLMTTEWTDENKSQISYKDIGNFTFVLSSNGGGIFFTVCFDGVKDVSLVVVRKKPVEVFDSSRTTAFWIS